MTMPKLLVVLDVIAFWLLAAFAAFLLAGCSRAEDNEVPMPAPHELLAAKMERYAQLLPEHQDAHGFVETAECDALLFSALVGVHVPVDLRAARDMSGRWYRRPAMDCYPAHSGSSISRDMLLGVLWWAWAHRDAEIVESLWAYGAAHKWVMGEGPRSRTQLTPVFVATMAQVAFKLGGKDRWQRKLRTDLDFTAGARGYEAHLQVLHIMLRQRVYDTAGSKDQARLAEHAARVPDNALFQYAAGNVAQATDLLLEERYFPADRLPTSADRCSSWLYQREPGPDWEPCDKDRRHTGGELLFVGHLIING